MAMAVALCLLLPSAPPPVQAATSDQLPTSPNTIIASFVLNCVYYGNWPSDQDPFVLKRTRLGIIGNETKGLAEALKSLAVGAGPRFGGMRIDIVTTEDPEKLKDCQVVFIDLKKKEDILDALKPLQGLPILVVGATSGLLELGATLEAGFVGTARETRFVYRINLDDCASRGVSLKSGMLVRASEVLRDGRREKNPKTEEGGR